MSTRRSSNSAARPASPSAKSRPAGRDATPGRSGKAAGGRSVQRETRVPRPPREGDAPVETPVAGSSHPGSADSAAGRSSQRAGAVSRDRRAPKGAAGAAGKPTVAKTDLPPRRIDKSTRQRTMHAPVSAPPAEHVPRLLQAAFAERKAAQLPSSDTNCFRLVHDRWDELGGLVIEVWGPTAVIRIRNEIWLESSYRLAVRDALLNAGYESFHYIIDEDAKHSERQHAEREEGINKSLIEANLGAPTEPYLALENGMRLEINIRDGFSQGLYTDMRVVRADLRKRWKKRRVLNLFAYTCGFGVALAAENEVTNVDVSAKYLEWGKRNYRHNGLSTDAGFIARDAFEYLEKSVKKGELFDAVILDPPAYSRGKSGKSREFSIRRDFGALVEQALDVLAPGGEAFVSTNLADLTPDAFRKLIIGIALDRDSLIVKQWQPQPDYPAPAADYHLKAVLLRKGKGEKTP